MTGRSNKNHVKFDTLTQKKTFSQCLEKGYATMIAGKWQLGRDASLPDHFDLTNIFYGN